MGDRALTAVQVSDTTRATAGAGAGLERQCACGQHAVGGECEACAQKKGLLQHRRMAANPPDPVASRVHRVVSSPGRPLEADVHAYMRSMLGQDFSHVRTHADAEAAASARSVEAQAYTVGRHVVFGAGQYAPHTQAGRHLLAHELTHVAQQQHADLDARRGPLRFGRAGDAFEQQAEAAAHAVAGGRRASVGPPRSGEPTLRRLGAGDTFLRFFGIESGNFSDDELTEYLDRIAGKRKCDCGLFDFLSDDKAREIVKRWGVGKYRLDQDYHGVPSVEIQRILIQELLSGPTGGSDQEAIVKIFRNASASQVQALLDPAHGLDIKAVLEDLSGDNRKALLALLEQKLPDVGTPHVSRSATPGPSSGSCTVEAALQISYAQKGAETLVQGALDMLDQLAAKPAENVNVKRQLDCYFRGASAAQVAQIRQNFELVKAALPQVFYRCPADPFLGFHTSGGDVLPPEEDVQARALVVAQAQPGGPQPAGGSKGTPGGTGSTSSAGTKTAAGGASQQAPAAAGGTKLNVALFPDFFEATPPEQARIVLHETFHHALQQGKPKEIYAVHCGDPAVGAALVNAQSYAMFAAALEHLGLKADLGDCPDAWKSEMFAAARTAEIWVSDAVAALDAVLADPQSASPRTVANLRRHFKTAPTDTKVVRKIRDVLAEMRAGFTGELPLECESECGEDVAAYTGGLLGIFPRGGSIHLCPHWFEHLDHSERAETILHEVAHRYGGKVDEAYMKDPHTSHQYYAQSTDDALSNADSFAQFARMMQDPAANAPGPAAQTSGTTGADTEGTSGDEP
ncbi:eCIS core domain-containing protein [Paraburkholderia guartelaensis]|uniref:eCIS core domain-containing protein n=1 Tax=Paraburkholderia guartelaensis TaxID=2546446 RepID=UPI002AB7C573|nr:DUF4157 domain-containing protein [Paraburkholderia guartelaensis]